MIKPTVGRVVWFTSKSREKSDDLVRHDGQPFAALIVYVWSDHLVNLVVFDHNGNCRPRTSVVLNQGDEHDQDGASCWCEWMPYQKGQAAKTEALEKQLPR